MYLLEKKTISASATTQSPKKTSNPSGPLLSHFSGKCSALFEADSSGTARKVVILYRLCIMISESELLHVQHVSWDHFNCLSTEVVGYDPPAMQGCTRHEAPDLVRYCRAMPVFVPMPWNHCRLDSHLLQLSYPQNDHYNNVIQCC
jgi:hypothetical protein